MSNNNNYSEQCQKLLSTLNKVTTLITTEFKPTQNDMLDIQLTLQHLDFLKKKMADTNSKILVTGDLNSGKSTLVNALLKQQDELLPADQQPCTSIFCEVTPTRNNEEEEVIHGVKDIEIYDGRSPRTYDVLKREDLYHIMTTEEPTGYKVIKVYTHKVVSTLTPKEDQDILNITLVDSPGLNTDSVKTTAVYALQDDVDVVMFVVNAENHFTLSGKEFLTNVANERSQLFIVINRFDNIRDKERCKRLILEQIQQILPHQHDDSLVHFISAGLPEDPSFVHFEKSLRDFVLKNRTHSKLEPIQRDLERVVRDMVEVISRQKQAAETAWQQQREAFETGFLPSYHHLIETKEHAIKNIGLLRQQGVQRIHQGVLESLKMGWDSMDQVVYLGILSMQQYAEEISDTLHQQVVLGLRRTEAEADQETAACIESMSVLAQSQLEGYTIDTQSRHTTATQEVVPHVKVETKEMMHDIIVSLGTRHILSGILCITSGLAGCFFPLVMKSGISRHVSVMEKSQHHHFNRNWTIAIVLGATFVFSGRYTVSDIPRVIQRHVYKKFKASLGDDFEKRQTRRITRECEEALEGRQREIQSRIQDLVHFKQEQYNILQVKLQEAQFHLNHVETLYDKFISF